MHTETCGEVVVDGKIATLFSVQRVLSLQSSIRFLVGVVSCMYGDDVWDVLIFFKASCKLLMSFF